MTTFHDQVFQFGGAPLSELVTAGDIYYLDPANGNDSYDGRSVDHAFKSMETAEAALTADQNDILFYLAGATALTLQQQLVWDKSYTHLIGVCAPTMVGQRARIFQLSTLTSISPLISITGSGCVFKNLYIFQGVADTGSLIDVTIAGDRNYFKNVHFAGGGHATQAIDGGCSVLLDQGHENTFEDCTFGVDTVAAATGMACLVYSSETSAGSARNVFKNCHFVLKAGAAGAIFVEALATMGVDRYQIFRDCLFINLASTAMTEAFKVPAGFDKNDKRFLLFNCALIGANDWESGDRGAVYLNNGTITGGGNAGTMIASVVT